MTVIELQEMLEDMEPESEVLIATQPEWPLQFKILSIQVGYQNDELVYWITAGDHPSSTPYAPGAIYSGNKE